MGTKRMVILVAAVAFLALLWVASGVGAYPPADEPIGQKGVAIGSTMSLMMNYQGRLLDPTTGDPKPDGTYTMGFSIYNVSTGGTALWQETKYVEVKGGLFNTILGDVTPLPQSIFTGQDLWLGVKVGADAETSPRQQLLLMPYAIYAKNADTVDGMEGADLEESVEIDADISAHTAIADAHHARYTDAEAWAAVLASDGAGSGLDADTVDGMEGADLQRRVSGTCASGNAIRVINTDGTVTCEADDDTTYTPGAGLSLADTTFSVNFAGSGAATTAARSDHDHDARYYTESESDSRYVDVTGDTMSGNLTVGGDVEADRVTYSSPRTHYFVVGGEDFVPWRNVDYVNSGGCGGAYVSASGSYALVAPVHLPHGALVTEFEVFFYDTSSSDIDVTLHGQGLSSCGFFSLAKVASSGTSGYYSLADTSITSPAIKNTAYTYHVKAYSTAWDGNNLRIKGALVTYTISEAP